MNAKTETAKHTPGPWVQVMQATGREVIADYQATFGGIATVHPMPNDWETDANARLIAAAPDLLAACEGLLAVCFDYLTHDEQSDANCGPALRAAYAAVNSAKGGAA